MNEQERELAKQGPYLRKIVSGTPGALDVHLAVQSSEARAI
jgi:hypothetical protein